MHRDIVTKLPHDAVLIGSNDKCTNQAFIIPDRVLSVQGSTNGTFIILISGHPEFNQAIVEFLLDNRHFKGVFTTEVYDEAFPHAAEEHDGVKVGEGIMNFILGVKA